MKIFSVEEANSLLPSVRGLVKKIQKAHSNLTARQDECKQAAESADHGGGGIAGGSAYAANLMEMTALVGRLEELGVQLKDFARGLIDFPTMRDGKVVLLCWQLGEGDTVQWWHDVDAGFAGRMPL